MLYSSDRSQAYLCQSQGSDTRQPAKATGRGNNVVPHPANRALIMPATVRSRGRGFSSDFWTETCKRHCEPRAHVRELLNKYIHPHAVV